MTSTRASVDRFESSPKREFPIEYADGGLRGTKSRRTGSSFLLLDEGAGLTARHIATDRAKLNVCGPVVALKRHTVDKFTLMGRSALPRRTTQIGIRRAEHPIPFSRLPNERHSTHRRERQEPTLLSRKIETENKTWPLNEVDQ